MKVGLPPAALRPGTRALSRWIFSPTASWPTVRRRMNFALAYPPPKGTTVTPTTIGAVAAEDVRPARIDESRVLLYAHGGGYAVGSARACRALVARLGAAADARVIALDYRMGPEHPYPAAVDDGLAAYRALVAHGVDPSRIAFAGDSAGGGLALAVALRLREAGEPLPAVLGLICPWPDLTPGAHARRGPAPLEPTLSADLLIRFADAYLPSGQDPTEPTVSPLFADLAGLPPVVMHSGADDILASDARELEKRARAAGVDIEHRVYDGLWHDFHLMAHFLAGPGGDAPRELGQALGRRLGRL
ncbi:alpha/beta hydrolase [Mycobacterium neumannii]|uniref:alpha/beta hydrolase n=1 Tax=Mycobacterium neumannii TaxID=2048551 RepID=UPI003AB28E78